MANDDPAPPDATGPTVWSRRRLPEADRRAQIIREATRLFAEDGFGANTRQLAQRLGTTQPLLYRYFPSKESLIEAVLNDLYARRIDRDWQAELHDRSVPLRDRLQQFSYSYATGTYDHDWIRIYMYAGLAGGAFNRKYIGAITEPILKVIALEIRFDVDPAANRKTVPREELDYLWLFHGGLYYHAIRQHIYGLTAPQQRMRELINRSVDSMILGMRALIAGKPLDL